MNTTAIAPAWWDNTLSTKPIEREYLEFNTPPLALVLAMQKAGKYNPDIHDTLTGLGKSPHIKADHVVSLEDQTQAAEIYDYFAKKYLLRRLKGEYISKFMQAVDELCENRKRIDVSHARVLVTLPQFYNENKKLESLMKGAKSFPKSAQINYISFNQTVEFVEKLHLKTSRTNEMHYFFKTPKNYLMRIVVNNNDLGKNAWDFVAQQKNLRIKADAYTHNIRGYDFFVITPTVASMEIFSD